jgi:hypothetical protein
VVTESNHRDEYQAVAPATQDGLSCPRVIEKNKFFVISQILNLT